MGVDYCYHYGPYIQCTSRVNVIPEFKKICSRVLGHKVEKDAAFCSECGEATKEVVDKERRRPVVDQHDMAYEDCGERLSVVHDRAEIKGDFVDHIFISNHNHDGSGEHGDPRYYEEVADEITPERIERELKAFEEYHAEDLAKLRAAYGEDRVKVKWGVMHYSW